MTQMQAAMFNFAAPVAKPDSTSASRPTTDTRQRFDWLLGQAVSGLDTSAQNAVERTAETPDGALVNEKDEVVTRDLGLLATLLVQSPGLAMFTSQLQVQGQTSDLVAAGPLAAADPTAEQLIQPQLAGEDLKLLTTLQQQTNVEMETMTAAMPMSTSGAEVAAEHPIVELLAQLEAEATEVVTAPAAQGTPQRWGQLARYWLLRGADQKEFASDSGQTRESSALDADTIQELSLESQAAVSSKEQQPLSLRATTEPQAEVLSAQATSQIAELDASDQSNQVHQFAVHLDVATAGATIADSAQVADATHVARPGLPLSQQLEQGLATGLRQQRLLQSPEGVTVRLRLYPESLGEVRIELKLAGNTLTAQLRALEPQAVDALRSELPLLKENLANQGFTEVFLGAETAEYFGHSAGREQQPFQERQAQPRQQIIATTTETTDKTEAELTISRLDYRL